MKPQLLALLLTAALAAPAGAQSLLDGQLGPTAAPAKEEPKPAPKPEEKPAKPAAPAANTADIVSPDAARRVDDADLINKLTKPDEGKKEDQAAEQMKAMIERMGQSQTRLTKIDPGDVTQETQRRIIADLDFFIELARKQQQQGQSQSQGQPQDKDQERQYSQGNQQQPGQNQGGSNAAQNSFLPKGNQAQPQPGEDIRARAPEEWGRLRPRERDLISHGANEEYLAPYRDMIERYYQSLAELGSRKK
jgi:hypothetical protein